MNPPFTRATNHEGAHADITNPAFAAFDATRADQTAMGDRTNRLGDDTCYHGNAGVASAFAALAHKKLKPGGVLALVLPLSVANGLSWQGFRKMIDSGYTDVTVLSISANGRDMSFSSDTGMAECLVIARRLKQDESPNDRARFTSLNHRPQGFAHASSLAGRLLNGSPVRSIEDGPYGGTPLIIGEELAGGTTTAPVSPGGGNWGAVRLTDYSLAQTAYALSQSELWLPGSASSVELKMASLGDVGRLGLVDRDINGPAPRGPFNKTAPSPTATYPALWNHHARQEKHIVCLPDSQLIVRLGMEDRAADVWATASRAHLNRDFTIWLAGTSSCPHRSGVYRRQSLAKCQLLRQAQFDYAFARVGQFHSGPAIVLVALQPSAVQQGANDYPVRGSLSVWTSAPSRMSSWARPRPSSTSSETKS